MEEPTDEDLIGVMKGMTGVIYRLSQKHSSFQVRTLIPPALCELSRVLNSYEDKQNEMIN